MPSLQSCGEKVIMCIVCLVWYEVYNIVVKSYWTNLTHIMWRKLYNFRSSSVRKLLNGLFPNGMKVERGLSNPVPLENILWLEQSLYLKRILLD
jgi:hypothetical protein